MVGMRVGQYHHVQPTNTRPCQRGSQGACGRPSIDEHRMTVVPVEDGIPLADVEDREARLHRYRRAECQKQRRHHNAEDRSPSRRCACG